MNNQAEALAPQQVRTSRQRAVIEDITPGFGAAFESEASFGKRALAIVLGLLWVVIGAAFVLA